MMRNRLLLVLCFGLVACASKPVLNNSLVRPWDAKLAQESLSSKPYIAHYSKGNYELLYLATHHENDPTNNPVQLINELFKQFQFNFILIESIPHSEGENPQWFVQKAMGSIKTDIVEGGEPVYTGYLASFRHLPFAGAEMSHKEIFLGLKARGYTDIDILGFYLVRQIPSWRQEGQNKNGLLVRNAPAFLHSFCANFGIPAASCPKLEQIDAWYRRTSGKPISADVGEESNLLRMATTLAIMRDEFLLQLIQDALVKYKKVAVVYDGIHFLTLKTSLEAYFGKLTGAYSIEN